MRFESWLCSNLRTLFCAHASMGYQRSSTCCRSIMHSSEKVEAGEGDPSLDFTSFDFDALKALHTDPSRLQLPCPSVQPYDNLDAYESGKCFGIQVKLILVFGVHTVNMIPNIVCA